MSFYRAYIVKGGTVQQRERILGRQIQADPLGMFAQLKRGNEHAIAFSCEHRDFDNLQFSDIKALVEEKAPTVVLPPNFEGALFRKDTPMFGTIDI